jgi:predicted DNA-binding transcriptional regulator YafY
MQETSARLLRLLSLLQARPDWPGAELATRLDITPRTLRRDVQRLRSLGYPVHATPGVAGGYRLGAGAALPPLLLDDDEAVAVAVSLQTAASQTVTGIAETALRALTKLEQVLPGRLRERVATLGLATVALPRTAPTIDPGLLTEIAGACRSRRTLAFAYRSHGGEVTQRQVEPHRVVHTGYRWYLVARDIDRDDWRTFRVDRIDAPLTPGARFIPRDPPDAAAFVANSVTAAPYRFRARALIRAPAHVVADQVPPTVAVVEPAGDGTCLLTTGADALDALAFYLAMLGAEFTILEPPELITVAGELAGRLHRAAGLTPDRSAQPARH